MDKELKPVTEDLELSSFTPIGIWVIWTDIRKAAEAISKADALLFTNGAGLDVDAGLPDFRFEYHL